MEKCVLIFRSAALGDFILAIPAIHEARKNYSQYKIIFLTIHTADKQHQKKIKHYVDSASKTPWMELVPNGVIDKTIVLSSVTDIKYLISVKRKLSSYDFEEAVLMLDPASPILGRLKKYILIRVKTT